MKNRRNYYRVLQVQPDAPLEVIRASYKALMRELKHHPDLGGDVWNAQVINEAYATLRDEKKRHEYDRKLFERYTKQPVHNPFTNQKPIISLFCPFCKRPLARESSPGQSCPTCKSPLQSLSEDELQKTCRRAVPRIKKSGKFTFYTTWPQKGIAADLIDISKVGLRFQTRTTLFTGMLIKLSSPHFLGVAKIKNIHKLFGGGSTQYSVGAEFVSVKFKESRGSFYSTSA